MRMILISIFFLFADLISAQTNYPPTYYIPAAGQTINNLDYYSVASQTFYVTTSGAVNLGSNTYTLTYASLPSANSTWNVIFDASNLTLTSGSQVNLFGETPLSTFNGITKFYINFSVVWDAGVPSKKVSYFSSLDDLTNFTNAVTFNNTVLFNKKVTFKDTVNLTHTTVDVGQVVVSQDTAGKLGFGCVPWCTTGNSGLSNSNFLGNIDTVGLNFRVNNTPSGRIDYNLQNTSFGYQSLLSNTSGLGNLAIGYRSMYFNSTGTNNTASGYFSLANNTTGISNTGVGFNAIYLNSTGDNNTGIGIDAGQIITTGSNNTFLGASTNGTTSATHDAIAVGYQAVASNNQLSIAPAVNNIYFSGHSSANGYVLTDTTGNGNYVPKPPYQTQQTYFTPVTGDSITLTTSANLINPAGTIANLTIILPASPFGGEILEFSFNQIVTTLAWSTAASADADAVNSNVAVTASAGATIKIQFNSTTSTWYNY